MQCDKVCIPSFSCILIAVLVIKYTKKIFEMAAGVFRKSVSWTQDAVHRLQGLWNTLYHFWRRKNLKDCNLLPNSSFIACITSYQTEFIAVQPSMLLENLQILVPSQQKTIIIALQSSTAVRAVADWNMAFFDGGN